MNRLIQLTLILVLIVVVKPSIAEDEPNENLRTEAGEIFEINLVAKTAIIGGYLYGFKGTQGYELPTVKMIGSNYGSFGLLQTGMKVQVTYLLAKDIRIVTELSQLSSSTEIGDGGFLMPSKSDER